MRKNSFFWIYLLICCQVFSLEIWQNQQLLHYWDTEELTAFGVCSEGRTLIPLLDILPFFDQLREITFYSAQGELDIKDESLLSRAYFIIEDKNILLSAGPHIFSNPVGLRIEGDQGTELKELSVWMEVENAFLKKEIELFGQLHNIRMDIQIQEDLSRSLSRAVQTGENIPHLVFYSHIDLVYILPFLAKMEIKPDFIPNPEIMNRISNTALSLFYRMDSWNASDDNAQNLAESFISIGGGRPEKSRELLNQLSRQGSFSPLPLYEIDITLVSTTRGNENSAPLNAFINFIHSPFRLEGLTIKNQDIYLLNQLGENSGIGTLNFYSWEYQENMDRLLHVLPLVRSGLLSPEEAEKELRILMND